MYLVDLFIDTVRNFGKTKNSVVFYKNQLTRLYTLGQVTKEDMTIIYGLLGIKNTDVVKWAIVEPKLNTFKLSIALVNKGASQLDKLQIIDQLYKENSISDQIKDILNTLYGKAVYKEPQNTAATVKKPTNMEVKNIKQEKPKEVESGNMIPRGSYTIKALDELQQKLGLEILIREVNTNNVCSGDAMYYYHTLVYILKNKNAISNIEDCKVVVKLDNDNYDGCSGSRKYNYIVQDVKIIGDEPLEKKAIPKVNTTKSMLNVMGCMTNTVITRSC